MRIRFRLLLAGLALMAPWLAGAQVARAAVDVGDFAAVDCDGIEGDADCLVTIAPGLGLLAPRSDLFLHEDGQGFDLIGDASIPTGGDPIALAEASLTIRMGAFGGPVESLVGVALMPMPNGGFLGPVEVTERPYAAVGFAPGAELLALEGPIADAPLHDDRSYFFFDAVARFAAELPPISMQTPGGAGVVVLDPTDPFFYVAGEVQGFGGDGKKKEGDADGASSDGSGASDGSSASDGSASGDGSGASDGADAAAGSDSGDASSDGSDGAAAADDAAADDPDAVASDAEASDDDDATGIAGFAFSLNGLIPFDPVLVAGIEDQMPSFDGHFFQRTSAPLSPLPIEATGEFVYDLDPDDDGDTPFTPEAFAESPDLAYGINGSLEVGIPFLKFFSFGFPLGEASASIIVAEDDMRAAFSGRVTADEFLPGLPIPIRPSGDIEVYGLLAADDVLHSYIHAEGAMGIDASVLGSLSGVPLGELYSTDAVLHVDVLGLFLRGTTTTGIHPSVKLEGQTGYEVFIAPDGYASLKMFGNFVIGGERLENAEMIVDTSGVRVNGRYLSGHTAFEMAGELRGDGYLLQGSAALADPVETNVQDRLALANEILAREETVAALELSLAAAQAGVSALLPVVETAQAAVDAAQAAVNSLNSSISYHSSKASSYYSSYKYWRSKSCKWYDAKCQATRASKMSYYYGKYSYHVSVRASLYVSRDAANAVLSEAKSKLAAAQSNLSSAQAAFTLAQEELQNGIAALQAAQAELDALPAIEGTLEMIATIGIENDEVWAGVEGVWNGQPVTDGSVELGNPGEACLVVPVAGTLCSPI
jgi:hypothetical protein